MDETTSSTDVPQTTSFPLTTTTGVDGAKPGSRRKNCRFSAPFRKERTSRFTMTNMSPANQAIQVIYDSQSEQPSPSRHVQG